MEKPGVLPHQFPGAEACSVRCTEFGFIIPKEPDGRGWVRSTHSPIPFSSLDFHVQLRLLQGREWAEFCSPLLVQQKIVRSFWPEPPCVRSTISLQPQPWDICGLGSLALLFQAPEPAHGVGSSKASASPSLQAGPEGNTTTDFVAAPHCFSLLAICI